MSCITQLSSLLWELLVCVGGSKDRGGEGVAGDHVEQFELGLSHVTFKNVSFAYQCRREVSIT